MRRAEREAAREDARMRLLKAVHARPGLTSRDAIRMAEIGWSTYYELIKELGPTGHVRLVRHGGRALRLYPRHGSVVAGRQLVHGTAERIAKEILLNPGHDALSLAVALSLPRRTIYFHLQRLVSGAFVSSRRERDYRDLTPTAALRDAIERDTGRAEGAQSIR